MVLAHSRCSEYFVNWKELQGMANMIWHAGKARWQGSQENLTQLRDCSVK